MKRYWLVMILTALAAGCTSPTPPMDEVLLPRLKPLGSGTNDARPQALLVGRLVIDKGCIKVGNTGEAITVLWHNEVELVPGERSPVLRDTSTGRTYRIGETVKIGGGSSDDPKYVARELPEVASRCGPPYFVGYFSK